MYLSTLKWPALNPAKYDLLLDDTSTTNIMYIWEAKIWSLTSSSLWRIKKINMTTWIKIWWAWSNTNFDKIWDNRTILTYSQ